MTAVRTARSWLTGHDPGLVALRKALRVTVAACIGFFVCEYLLGLSTLATYAVFGAIAFGVLSDVSGPPAQRTRTFLGAWPVALVLVAIGTATARSTTGGRGRDARRGVRGGVRGGRRPAHRGRRQRTAAVLRAPLLPALRPRLAAPAAHRAHDRHRARHGRRPAAVARGCAGAVPHAARRRRRRRRPLRRRACPPTVRGRRPRPPCRRCARAACPRRSGRPARAAATAAFDPRHRRAAHDAGARPAARAPAARPPRLRRAGRGRRRAHRVGDALARVRGGAARHRAAPGERAARRGRRGLPRGPRRADRGPAHRRRAAAGGADRRAHRRGRRRRPRAGRAVRAGTGAPPDPTAPPRRRRPGTSACRPRCCGGAGSPPTSPRARCTSRTPCGSRWASPPPASLADLLDLSHGFWVLLATLIAHAHLARRERARPDPGVPRHARRARSWPRACSRSSATTRSSTPSSCRSPWSSRSPRGPCSGPAAAQFGFTIVVSVLFAQLAPTTWKLAEVRLTDVVVGGLIGALIGAAVWPRGGAGEVRRSAAACLRSTADELVATVRALTGTPVREQAPLGSTGCGRTRRTGSPCCSTSPTPSTAASPRTASPAHDWLEVLAVVQRAASDAEVLRDRYPAPDPLPWPAVSRRLVAAAEDVARAFREAAAAAAGDDRSTRPAPGGAPRRRPAARPVRRRPARHPARHRRLGLDARPVRGPDPGRARRRRAGSRCTVRHPVTRPEPLYRGGMSTAVGLEAARRAFLAGEWSEARAAEVVRPAVVASWARCRRGGLDPDAAVATFQGPHRRRTGPRQGGVRRVRRLGRALQPRAARRRRPRALPRRRRPGPGPAARRAAPRARATGSARPRWAPPRPRSRSRPERPWRCPGPSTTPRRSPAWPRRRRRSPTPRAWSARSPWSATASEASTLQLPLARMLAAQVAEHLAGEPDRQVRTLLAPAARPRRRARLGAGHRRAHHAHQRRRPPARRAPTCAR